jgi:hypothetical protein
MKTIFVQVDNGRAHEDVDKELVLSFIDEKLSSARNPEQEAAAA